MKREPIIDNAKFFLIFFVILGHLIQPFTTNLQAIDVIYQWIYLFHMPVFIFLSGLFAKGLSDRDSLAKLCKRLLIPYIIFHALYTVYYIVLGIEGWGLTLLNPRWSLWFLLSLFCWNLLLIVFKRIPKGLSITLSIVIGVAIGYVEGIGQTLSLARTFAFFPFFLLGYWLTAEHILLLKEKVTKTVAVSFLGLVALAIYLLPSFSSNWLLASSAYEALGSPQMGGLIRIGIYLVSTLMAISVLTLIPRGQFTFTKIGEKTLYIYLLHGVFIHFFRETSLLKIDNPIDLVGLVIIGLVIVIILSSRPVMIFSQPLIEGRATLFRETFAKVKHGDGSRVFSE